MNINVTNINKTNPPLYKKDYDQVGFILVIEYCFNIRKAISIIQHNNVNHKAILIYLKRAFNKIQHAFVIKKKEVLCKDEIKGSFLTC